MQINLDYMTESSSSDQPPNLALTVHRHLSSYLFCLHLEEKTNLKRKVCSHPYKMKELPGPHGD